MKDFNHTVGVLVKAYLNNELIHGNCEACAVANLLKDRCVNLGIPIHRWANAFITAEGSQIIASDDEIVVQTIFGFDTVKAKSDSSKHHLEQINTLFNSSDYTKEEYARIEFVFETAPQGYSEDDHMFNGLMEVVDVLAEIHGIDLTAKEQAKALFVKH